MSWHNFSLGTRPNTVTKRRRFGQLEALEARQLLTGDVVINEFVASNDKTLETIAGATPDWIELHNRSEEAVDLTGWQLRDSSATWTIPELTIEPKGYVVVFASGNDIVLTEPHLELHTNFKLKSGGEYLGLMRPDGAVAHEYNPYPDQTTDQSFGLSRDETFSQYFATPTPGVENPDAPRVVISELMSSNQTTLADSDGDFADWLEIYNDSDSPANLSGWTLESDGIPWEFPEVTLSAKSHLLVFASGNDRRDADAELHTNFKLGSNGDEVSLNRPDSSVAHRFYYPDQRVDISYGLTNDLAETQYFESPTPGIANLTGFDGVRFRPRGGIIRGGSVSVQLSTELDNAVIRYTTDGSQPNEQSKIYQGSFSIDESTTVTATTYAEGREPITTRRSYILEKDVRNQSNEGKPQTWGFSSDYAIDTTIPFEDWVLTSTPSVMLTVDADDLFSIEDGIFAHPVMEGDEWQRDVEIEFLPAHGDSEGTVRMATTGLIRTTGRGAELNPAVTSKFSMEIEFAEPLEPGLAGKQLFENDLKNPASERYFGLKLRAGHADSWLSADSDQRRDATYARSWFVRASQRAMGQPAVESHPVNVFINNMYWGIYDLTDRPSAEMAAEQLGGNAADYDVIDEKGAIDGTITEWDALIVAAKEDLANPEAYESVASQIDIENLIDFIVLKRYAGIGDHTTESWFAANNRDSDEGFRFFFDDNAESLALPEAASTTASANPYYAPEFLFEQLMRNDGFRRTFADRTQMHISDSGALSTQEAVDRWSKILSRNNQVYLEAARWGDYRLDANPIGDAQRYSAQTLYERAHTFGNNYFRFRNEQLLDELIASNEFPNTPSPDFLTPPGLVENGHRLQLRADDGVVYFTTDGSDPANPDGTVSDTAELFKTSIRLRENTQVRARTLDGHQWSAVSDGTFLMTDPVPLKITEIMYHPALDDPNSPYDDDDFEFIEIQNAGDKTINLNGIKFDRGIGFEFKDGRVTELAPNEFVIVVKNEEAFASRYQTDGIKIAGEFTGQLGNGGEPVELSDSFGQTIQKVNYLDTWYPQSDGEGFSLSRSMTAGDDVRLSNPRDWTLSSAIEGTPGIDESQIPDNAVVISEVMIDTADESGDWIELHNTTNEPITIGGWFLSDSSGNARKFRIPVGTELGAGAYMTFTQSTSFGNADNGDALVPFAIESQETLYVASGDADGRLGGYRHVAELPSGRPEISVGRILKGDGTADYAELSQPTFGNENVRPRVGPIVFNEIMVVPNDERGEYVELINISNEDVELFAPGRPNDPWKITEGIKFTFPESTTLPAGGTAVIVKSDPVIFKERAELPEDVQVFGPFKGSLKNEGEAINLRQAWIANANAETQYLTVDRVEFDDATPWPTLATIGVSSLQRVDVTAYGNDAANWAPSILGGTPGIPNVFVDSSPRSVPMVETFDQSSIDQLKGWNLSSGRRSYWWLDNSQMVSQVNGCRSCSVEDNQTAATLAVDIEDSTDLAILIDIDNAYGDFKIQISDDQRNWFTAFEEHLSLDKRTIAADLGTSLIANGLDGPGTRYIRVQQLGDNTHIRFNSIAVISHDVVGPWVQDYAFLGDDGATIDRLELTFDEPVAAETFTRNSIELRNPMGRSMAPLSIASDDGLTWTVEFLPQTSVGTYFFELDSDIEDQSGNALNRFNYSVNKQSPTGERFEATSIIESNQTQSFPYESDFGNRWLDWSFSAGPNSSWEVVGGVVQGPHLHLHRSSDRDRNPSTSTADLPIDLAGLGNRDDLSFDFLGRGDSSVTVAASNDGQEWQPIYGLNLTNNFQTYSFDLDQSLAELGIDIDETVQLRFEHTSSRRSDIFIDNIRIGTHDVFGPRIVATDFDHQVGQREIATVTFNEPIDQTTLTENVISLRNPVGNRIFVESIRQVGDQSYEIAFPSQQLAGSYKFSVAPTVTDQLGNRINQNDSPQGGEVADIYSTSFEIDLQPTSKYPYLQSFADDSIENLDGWSFSSTGNAAWSISDGSLRGEAFGTSRLEAELNLDLREHADDERISLQFSAASPGYSEAAVFVGSEQGRWFWVTDIKSGTGGKVTHSIDLKKSLQQRGLSADGEVRLLFQVNSHDANRMSFDNITVNGEEVFGPRVIGNSQIQELENDTSKVSITFDVPVDPLSFTNRDATLTLTGGVIQANGVEQTGPNTFDVFFPTPAMAGIYNLNVGPNIDGTNGIGMNQTEDAFSGLEDDNYTGSVFVEFEPVDVPYSQDFLRPDITSLGGWMFHTINESGTRAGGEWRITSDFDPFGEYHLQQTQFADCWSQHDGILALDVTRLVGSTDLVLEFDMTRTTTSDRKSNGGLRNMGQLLVGSDFDSFTQVGGPEYLLDSNNDQRFGDLNRDGVIDLVPEFGEYVHYKFDLDQLLDAGGIEVDGTVYVNFHRLAFYSSDVTVFDNIRVYDSTETTPPPRIASVELNNLGEPAGFTTIDRAAIAFDQAIDGFDLGDLRLTRNGEPIEFAETTQLTTTDSQNWTLTNLLDSANQPGVYELTLDAETAAITSEIGDPLSTGFTNNWIDDRAIGDSNLDGIFNSRDLVFVFQAKEYEDDTDGNSTWTDGDWNADGDFTTADLVAAFQANTYVAAATNAAHENSLFQLKSGRRSVVPPAAAAAIDAALSEDDLFT